MFSRGLGESTRFYLSRLNTPQDRGGEQTQTSTLNQLQTWCKSEQDVDEQHCRAVSPSYSWRPLLIQRASTATHLPGT